MKTFFSLLLSIAILFTTWSCSVGPDTEIIPSDPPTEQPGDDGEKPGDDGEQPGNDGEENNK